MITITIKGISKAAHRELKRRAAAHRRSLNNEVISLLESSVHSERAEGEDVIQIARKFRDSLKFKVTAVDAKRFKEEGRA
jgi:plasmid stability protein